MLNLHLTDDEVEDLNASVQDSIAQNDEVEKLMTIIRKHWKDNNIEFDPELNDVESMELYNLVWNSIVMRQFRY